MNGRLSGHFKGVSTGIKPLAGASWLEVQGMQTRKVQQVIKNDREIVQAVRQRLAEKVGRERFDLWFGDLIEWDFADNRLQIIVPDQFLAERLRRSFHKVLQDVLTDACPGAEGLRYVVSSSDKSGANSSDNVPQPSPPTETHVSREPGVLQARPEGPQRFARFDDFVVGPGNQVAVTAAESIPQRLGRVSPLFLYGPSGTGKTHLLQSIWKASRSHLKRQKAVFLTAEQFTSGFLEALQGSGLPNFRRKNRDTDLLLIDDIQFFIGKQATLREVHYTIDSLLRNGKQLVLASNRPPAELSQLGPELMARMSAGLVCCLEPADLATRMQIVRNYVQARRLELSDEVLHLVASRIRGDARYLHGAIHRLEAMWEAYQQPISVQIAESALADLFHTTRQAVHLPDIEKAVCTVFGLDAKTLQSNRRSKTVSHPRMLAMWLARKYTRAAYAEIGEFFGHRAHNTVISAQQRVKTWLSRGTQIRTAQGEWQVEDAVRRVEAYLMTGS
jgi:chromosomal replication initiator protein